MTETRARFCLVGGLIIAGWCACSSSHTGSDSDVGAGADAGVASGELLQAARDAVCGGLAACCSSLGQTLDVGDCQRAIDDYITRMAAEDHLVSLLFDSSRLEGSVDQQAAERCLESVRSSYAQCLGNDDLLASDDEACLQMWRGSGQVGEACTNVLACAMGGDCPERIDLCVAGAECVVDRPLGPGRCMSTVRGEAGDGCRASCQRTGEDLECDDEGGTGESGDALCHHEDGLYCDGVCRSLQQEDRPCSASWQCTADARCSAEGRCVARQPVGGSCSEPDDCVAAAYCTQHCTPDCADDGECLAKKPDGQVCDSDEECLGGICEDVCGPQKLAATICGPGELRRILEQSGAGD